MVGSMQRLNQIIKMRKSTKLSQRPTDGKQINYTCIFHLRGVRRPTGKKQKKSIKILRVAVIIKCNKKPLSKIQFKT